MLNQKELLLWWASELRMRTSGVTLSKSLHMKPALFQHAWRRLHERGMIQARALINPYRLGFREFTFLLSLSHDLGARARTHFSESLQSHREVSWLGDLGGRYHLGVSILCGGPAEASRFLALQCEKSGVHFHEKALALRFASNIFGKKYLNLSRAGAPALQYRETPDSVKVDALDISLIKALCKDGSSSLRDLSRLCKAPHTTVERRLSRLESEGVIVGYINVSDGLTSWIQRHKVLISTRTLQPQFSASFYEWCNLHPRITHLIEAVGSWDFELGVDVTESSQMIELVREIHERFGLQIAQLEVMQELSCRKFSNCPFA